MRLKSTEFNAALAVLIAIGTSSGCGEDPVSVGVPGDFTFAGTLNSGGSVSNTSGGLSPTGTGGSTGGTFASGGTVSTSTGGTKATASGGSGGMPSGGKGGMASTTGGSGGTKATASGGSGGRSSGFGTGGRSSGGGGSGGRSSGGGGSGGKGAAVAFSAVGTIIGTRCSTCHGMMMPVLQNNAMLRDTLTMTRVADCGNNPLVTPNDASKSAILMLVNRMCAGGLAMPLGCAMTPCIPAADVTTITNWINSGAPP